MRHYGWRGNYDWHHFFLVDDGSARRAACPRNKIAQSW